MGSARILSAGIAAFLASCLFAETALAAELYFAGRVGISRGEGDGTGVFEFGPSEVGSGSDDDSSPVYGLALGAAVPLSDVIPWALRFPTYPCMSARF